MDQTKKPRRRLNILTRTARTKRIFARLREGWAYDDIAKEERLSAERVRQIVGQVLENRVLDRGEDHAHLQLERLRPALRLAGEAVARGELKAIGPLIKLMDRLDRHEGRFLKPFVYTESSRQRLLDKLNQAAANLADPETAGPLASGDWARPDDASTEAHVTEDAPASVAAAPAPAAPADWFQRNFAGRRPGDGFF